MIDQVSLALTIFLLVFMLVSFILMLSVSPFAWRAFRNIRVKSKNTQKIKPLRRSISDYLEKLSESQDEAEIHKLIETIRREAKKTIRIQPHTDQGQQADSILKWLDNFIVHRHISDLKNYGESAQIRYDAQKKDFKLMIVAQ